MRRPVTLYCPPPYENESLSSFIGRAAQVYRMGKAPLFVSLGLTLVEAERGAYDVDYAPNPQLVEILAACVPDWTGYSVEHGSFRGWRLTAGNRASYCQDCFEEDLRAGRTPYFRLDWGVAAVTCCWVHGIPLFTWQDVSANGLRRIPDAWLEARRPVRMPSWFDRDAKLRCQWESASGEVLRECLRPFERLQHAIEKPFLADIPANAAYDSLRLYVDQSVTASIKLLFTLRQAGHPVHVRDQALYPWVEPRVDFSWSAQKPSALSAMRRAGSVAWRRAYLQAAAWGLPSLNGAVALQGRPAAPEEPRRRDRAM